MAPNRRRSSWRLATGAGLEPASPACTGALAIELPCFILPLHCGLALLVTSRSTISSASIRLQRLRLACRSGAQLIPILAMRYGWARPGHSFFCTDNAKTTLNVARHAKKSEVEGEIESQIESQEVQEGQ